MSDSGGKWAWHVHHTVLVEKLYAGGLEERQRHITAYKPSRERSRRLRLLKIAVAQEVLNSLHEASIGTYSLRGALPPGTGPKVRQRIQRAIKVIHDAECPNCPWDGRTIFPRPKRRVK